MITEDADPVQTESIVGTPPLSPPLQFVDEQTALKALRDFVAVVYEPSDIIEPRPCLEGRKGGKPSWCLAADLPQKFDELRSVNLQGWHIYAGANPRNAFSASGDKNVLLARCLYADFDGGCTADEAIKRIKDAGLPRPTMLVNSGGGTHAWWRLHEPIGDLAAFTVLQKRLAATLKSDSSICNAERIMRLPGFLNCKAKYVEPRPVAIIEADPCRRYALAEIATHLVEVQKTPEPWTPPAGFTARAAEAGDHVHITSTLNKIPTSGEGGRNKAAFHAAAMLVKDFLLPQGEARMYLGTWNLGNTPRLDDGELDDILDSAIKYGKHTPGQKLVDQSGPRVDFTAMMMNTLKAEAVEPQIEPVAEPQGETRAEPQGETRAETGTETPETDPESAALRKAFDAYEPLPEGTWKPKPFTSKEFALASFRQEYLVKGILARNQPFITGGPAKALKTLISVDLAISLGLGGKFLGQFDVVKPTRVLLLSGESGEASIKDAARRICDAKGIGVGDANVVWDFTLPRISSDNDLIQLARVVTAYRCDVAIIDPAYLCLLAGGDGKTQAGNVLQMGPLLGRLTSLMKGTGTTIGICHHTVKRLEDPNEPPTLTDLSMAGFVEWARQWLLLGRREPFREGSGHHKLWLRAGGSAGHSGLYGIDVDEGQYSDDDPDSRVWQVGVNDGHELKEVEKARKAEAKAEYKKKQEHGKLVALTLAAANYLRDIPEGDTKSAIKNELGCTVKDRDIVLAMLIESGDVIETLILKGNHKTPREGYKWVGKANRSEQSEQSESSREAVGKTG